MAVNRANQPGAPRFNFMWFWAVVAVVIIGYSMFGDSEARPLEGDWNMVDELVDDWNREINSKNQPEIPVIR